MLKKFLAAMLALFAAVAFAAVDVNKATPAELDSVKGIGPAIAGKIVDERKNGSYKDWNDLITRVKGIGDTNAAKLSSQGLTVNGASYNGAAPAAKAEDKPTKAAKKAEKAAATTMASASAAAATTDAKAEAKKAAADKKAAAKKEKEEKVAAAKAEKAAKAASASEAKSKAKEKAAKPVADKASDAKSAKK